MTLGGLGGSFLFTLGWPRDLVWIHSKTRQDCESGKHRYRQSHVYPLDKSLMYKACKHCGEVQFTKIEIIDGKFTRTTLNIPETVKIIKPDSK